MATNTVTQSPSLANYATDPLRNFKFHVIINHPIFGGSVSATPVALGFMSVSGLGMQTDIIAYRQGAYNVTTQKMPGQSDFGPLVLQKGIILGDSPTDVGPGTTPGTSAGLLSWMQALFSVQQGTGNWSNDQDFRSSIDILVLDHPVTTPTAAVKAAFRVYNAWPTQLTFTDLDAAGNGFLVSQVTLAHEGWAVTFASKPGSGDSVSPPN